MSATALLSDCKQQFEKLRGEADKEWEALFETAVDFTNEHQVSSEFPAERCRKKKRMHDELATDECISDKERMKVSAFIAVIDAVVQQLQSRFSEQNVAFMTQLSFFTPASLLGSLHNDISIDDIAEICSQYGLNPADVHRELQDFRSVYKVCTSRCHADSIETVSYTHLTLPTIYSV